MNNKEIQVDQFGIPVGTWKCVICYEVAPCFCVDVTLCEEHAKEYDFGYGKSLIEMKKRINSKDGRLNQ